jgi:hypothetical protein
MAPDSDFITRLNSGDETPGSVDYTSIFTTLADELVQPQPAASTLGGGGANVANISIQDVCALRPVDHISIVADAVVHDLVLDALTNDGPANATRAAPNCLSTVFPSPTEAANGIAALGDLLDSPSIPGGSVVAAEPATAWYASPDLPTYSDVPASNWAFWEIEWAAARGIATGFGDDFRPDASWNRAQAVMWLWRMAGEPTGAPPAEFTDVPAGAWYRAGLDWASDEGVVRGFADDTFRPQQSVNRAQLAWWLWTFAGQPGSAPPHPFVDVRPGAWYEDGLNWVYDEGIVTGYPGPFYRGSRASTRAAVARMLFRLDQVVDT